MNGTLTLAWSAIGVLFGLAIVARLINFFLTPAEERDTIKILLIALIIAAVVVTAVSLYKPAPGPQRPPVADTTGAGNSTSVSIGRRHSPGAPFTG